MFILDVQTSRGFLWKPSRVESWMELEMVVWRKREERPRAGRERTRRIQSCGKRSLAVLWRWICLWPPAASLELLLDYVVSRKPRSSRLGGTLANAEKERGKKEGAERTASIRRERDAESRHTHIKRDERDERVGELIRRQECRPEETPTTVYTRFQTRCRGATVDHGHARLAMASTRLRTFLPFPTAPTKENMTKVLFESFGNSSLRLCNCLKFLSTFIVHLTHSPIFFYSRPDRLFSNSSRKITGFTEGLI